MQKLLTFFSKNINIYAIFNDQSFNDTLTNDIITFEQLGPKLLILVLRCDQVPFYYALMCLKTNG